VKTKKLLLLNPIQKIQTENSAESRAPHTQIHLEDRCTRALPLFPIGYLSSAKERQQSRRLTPVIKPRRPIELPVTAD